MLIRSYKSPFAQVVNLASTARQAVDYFFATATLALGGLVVTTLILPRLV